MYRLYAWPNSYAMGVHAILEEIGAAYDLRWVKIMVADLDPDFARISPHGRVPALESPDGALFETGAIALYLAERHPEAGLLVPAGDPDRPAFLQWFHYLATTLQPEVMIQFHPEFYFADTATQDALKLASMARLTKVLATLETALTAGPYFLGTRRTVIDYLFTLQAVWPEIYPGSIDDFPAINRQVETLCARPAVRRVHDLHLAEAATVDRSGMGAPAASDL